MPSSDGRKAALHAVIGPPFQPGLALSGHTDVVPVEGQAWSHDPFRLRGTHGRLYGRGAADMKGFLSAVLGLVPWLVRLDLQRPVHLAFSYDEEIGCRGVRPLLETLRDGFPKPALCVIGEPTSMRAALAHKGKTAGFVECIGQEGHSSRPDAGLNAIYMAADMIAALREIEARERVASPDEGARTTLHVGLIGGRHDAEHRAAAVSI